jgi:aminoglycoside 6'-N-acetyltransferase I
MTVVIEQVGALVVAAFGVHYPDTWPTLASGIEEARKSLAQGRISRVALDAQTGEAVGWAGGIPGYHGNVFELHPLAVHPDRQGQGIGTALVRDLEQQARARGAITLWLGSDDEDRQTTLSGIDLYPDVCGHIRAIRNPGRHPYEFYQRLGFSVVGVLPDANGFGRPDIFLAKRIGAVPPGDRFHE